MTDLPQQLAFPNTMVRDEGESSEDFPKYVSYTLDTFATLGFHVDAEGSIAEATFSWNSGATGITSWDYHIDMFGAARITVNRGDASTDYSAVATVSESGEVTIEVREATPILVES